MKKLASLLLAGVLVLSLSACGSAGSAGASAESGTPSSAGPGAAAAAETASGLPALAKDEIHIGAVFNTEIGTEGFSYALGQGFQALEDAGYKVDYAFSVPESAECETAIENLINQGCNVIYATSYGYGEYVADMAEKYPDVYFNHYSGSTTANNLATFFPKIEQSEYLCGIIAGKRTKSNQIGYLCSYPIPECVRMVDAFTLGAKSVNPGVTVNVKWTGSWFDPSTETATATELVNSGSDVIIAYLDSLNAAIAAANLGAYSFGYATSGYQTIPNSFLASPACDWKSFFLKDVQRITDGTWTGTSQLFGIEDGLVGLTDTHNLADGTEDLVNQAIEGFKNGTLDIWAGEISDNKGNVAVAKGKTLDEAAQLSLNWFVAGVNGSIS